MSGGGRGLVLGGGGITGIAWELGLAAGLAELGVDLRAADRVVGTSAGSVVGAQLTSPAGIEQLYETQLEPPTQERAAELGRSVMLRYAMALLRSRGNPEKFGRRLGLMTIAAGEAGRLPTLESRYDAIRSRLPVPGWPDADLRVCVVDARTGAFRVLTRDDGVPLFRAVAASCAVPLVFPPVPIDGRVYIDGGARTGTNADVARGCTRVVAIAPMGRSAPGIPSPAQQLARLGVPHVVISPDAAAIAAIGKNVLDPAARAASARAGRAQAASVVDEVRAVWG